jgi:hypothetical protein
MTLRLVFHAINGTGVGHLSRVGRSQRNGRRFAGEVLCPQALEDYFVEILDFCSRLHCA